MWANGRVMPSSPGEHCVERQQSGKSSGRCQVWIRDSDCTPSAVHNRKRATSALQCFGETGCYLIF